MVVKVSPKYQVVIPEAVRHALDIKTGMLVDVIVKGKVAYLVPVPNMSDLQDKLCGKLSQKNLRDKKDRKI